MGAGNQHFFSSVQHFIRSGRSNFQLIDLIYNNINVVCNVVSDSLNHRNGSVSRHIHYFTCIQCVQLPNSNQYVAISIRYLGPYSLQTSPEIAQNVTFYIRRHS
uniref:(northern house mosquito) hypothetical protein n=1 Tax=Culex pipiens TaxID=7175 RepID=A0A8D8BPK7_CULPI